MKNIIKQYGFDFDWTEEKVWNLKYPIEKMSIKELEWHFYIPFWGNNYDIKPIDVIKYPEKYFEEYQKIMNSDLKYPIDIMKNKGRWTILDGLHRLAKCHLLNIKMVKVRKIPRTEIFNIK